MLRYLILLVLYIAPAFASGTVNCTNTAGDVSAIQSAISTGGVVTLNGNCGLGASRVNVNVANVTLQAGTSGVCNTIVTPAPTNRTVQYFSCFRGSNSGTYCLTITANGVTVKGIDFEGCAVLNGSSDANVVQLT